jgi:hypothetical protein
MVATTKLDTNKVAKKRGQDTFVRKYRSALVREIERVSQKRTPLSRLLLEKFPSVIEDLGDESIELGEQLVMVVNRLLKPDQRAVVLRFDVNGLPAPFEIEQQSADHYVLVQDHPQGGYSLLRTEDSTALSSDHPLVARYMSIAEEERTRAVSSETQPPPEPEVPETVGQLLVLSAEDYEMVPYEQDFVIERVVQPRADQMRVEHLVADLQYLMPHRKRLHEVAELVKRPERSVPKRMRFSQYPIITIDEVSYEDHEGYLNEMHHFRRQNAVAPFVRPVYVQERDAALPQHHDIVAPSTAVANTFDPSHDHPNLWLLPSKDTDLSGAVGEIMCKAIPAKKLCQYAQQYGVRCGDKTAMCRNLTPFLFEILHDYRKPDLNKSLYEDLEEALLRQSVFSDDPPVSHQLEVYGTLPEDKAKATGVLHVANPSTLTDIVVFDVDAYVRTLQNSKKGDTCTVYPFLKDSIVSYQATVKSNRDGVLRLTDTFDGTDRYVNTINLEDNYMFVHPHPTEAFAFAKHRLLDTNIAALSSQMGVDELTKLLSIDVEQFAHYHGNKKYAPHLRNTVADRSMDGYKELTRTLGELFSVSSMLQLSRNEQNALHSFLKGPSNAPSSENDDPVPPRVDVPDWVVQRHPHNTGRTPRSLDELLSTLLEERPETMEEIVKALHDTVHRTAISAALRKVEGIRLREDDERDRPPIAEPSPLPSVDELLERRSLAPLHEYGDAHREAFEKSAQSQLRANARRLRKAALDFDDLTQEHLVAIRYQRIFSASKRTRLRGPKMVAQPRLEHHAKDGTLQISETGVEERDDAHLSATDGIARTVTTDEMNKARISSELRDVCHALGVVLAQKDVEIIERDVFMLVLLQMQTLRTSKRTLSAKEKPLYQRFALLVSYSALVIMVIQLQSEPPVLSKEHASYFASDGYPLRERTDGRGTLEYTARVMMSVFGAKLPFMTSVDNLRARIKNTIAFYLNRNKGMAKQIERLSSQQVVKKGVAVSPAVVRRYARTTRREERTRASNRRGRVVRAGARRAVLPFKERLTTDASIELLSTEAEEEIGSAPYDPTDNERDDKELTALLEQARDLFQLDTTAFVDKVVLASSYPAGFRASFGPELAYLIYSIGTPELVKRERVLRRVTRCRTGTLLEAFRAVQSLSQALLDDDEEEEEEGASMPPMQALALNTDPHMVQCVRAVGRAIERGMQRLVLSMESNRVDMESLKLKEDQLRETMMSDKLKVYQDMEPEERGILKMLKDSIGFELQTRATEEDGADEARETEPTHLDVTGENDDDGDEETF